MEKQQVFEAIAAFPEDAMVEDAIEQLCFIAKVRQGIQELEMGPGIPHTAAKQQILSG